MKEKTLSVGKVRFSHYCQNDKYYLMTICLVLYGGRIVCEYINYGDGEPGYLHTLDKTGYATMAKTFACLADLEGAIQEKISTFEIERKLRERIKRDGFTAWRYLVDGKYQYRAQKVGEYTWYTIEQWRNRYPSMQFYQRNIENNFWEWK